MAFIPQDIIFGILSKLPVKSQCRFKCVSKSWLALFTDPHFVKTHLIQTQRHRLLAFNPANTFTIDHETTFGDKLIATELEFSKHNEWVEFIGSCNGLLCFNELARQVFFLYNPSTREYSFKEIPKFQNKSRLMAFRYYGFGYAQSIDDYKLVIISWSRKVVHVFSLRNNSWKSINHHDYHYHSQCYELGIPLNGAIHWVAYYYEHNFEIIAAFDLVEEKFKTLPLPNFITNDIFFIEVVEGCLCLHLYFVKYEIWVMKEYGVQDSWTRIWMAEDPRPPIYMLRPLSFQIKNREMMFSTAGIGRLRFCYLEIDGTWKDVEVDGLPDKRFNVQLFVESLVSPNCYLSEGNNDS